MKRQDPDLLLEAIKEEENSSKRGKLKIFFGYAAGVGKTYSMLEAAHQAKERSIDVVVGYVEPHARPETSALLQGLEQLNVKEVPYRGITMHEFDIDAALKRHPKLILVDELAHTNAPGSRHTKRYQDIEELLTAGIDVYTTVNVQHIESLNDTVASFTGIPVQERIPDHVFDKADQVELVDIEPKELLERMAGGKIYREEQAERAQQNFFTIENLTALREIALRRCADRVNLRNEMARELNHGDYYTDEHILVCLSPSPSNARLIRTAARMASAFRAEFTALYIEPSDYDQMPEEDQKRLRKNIHLASQLGAQIELGYGDDTAYQIAEFARLGGVSKLVIGRSSMAHTSWFSKTSLTDRLIREAPNLDIYVIPDNQSSFEKRKKSIVNRARLPLRDIGIMIGILVLATLVGVLFTLLGFTEANIVAVYLFAVLVISVMTNGWFCGMLSSIISVLVFNFFFTVPKFTFRFNDPSYYVTFVIMFMLALLSGSLASRLKETARRSVQTAFRTKTLFETNQMLQKITKPEDIVRSTAEQLSKLFKRDVVIYLSKGTVLSEPIVCKSDEEVHHENLTTENEKATAVWAMRNNKHAGAFTDTLSNAKCMYLAVRVNHEVYGVCGIAMHDVPLDAFENDMLLSVLGECALALENTKNAREKEEAAVLAKNEQTRANLLRAISHDLRTPLTSISGSADYLSEHYKEIDDPTRSEILKNISDDSQWLINLVENLLAITRIEGGSVKLRTTTCDVDDMVEEAVRHVRRHAKGHTIKVIPSQDMNFVKVDPKLIVQVLINLLDNALKYAPSEFPIVVSTQQKGKNVQVSVADNGPGIPDAQKEKIFDMFYTGEQKVADSCRSLGLGLSLCKSILHVHGGNILVMDNKPNGTIFRFSLPVEEVTTNE